MRNNIKLKLVCLYVNCIFFIRQYINMFTLKLVVFLCNYLHICLTDIAVQVVIYNMRMFSSVKWLPFWVSFQHSRISWVDGAGHNVCENM